MECKRCIVCGSEAPKFCSGCKNVCYCSKEHQKLHWNHHKASCQNFKVEYCDYEEEHHFVASMNIKAGTVILKEDPFLIAPKQIEGPAVCIGCSGDLGGQGVGCPRCSWPMCGKSKCWSKGSHHELGECALLKAAGGSLAHNFKGVNLSIMVLRYLSLKKKDPAKYGKFADLQFETVGKTAKTAKTMEIFDKAAVVEMVKRFSPEVSVTEEWILGLCGMFLVEGIDLPSFIDERSDGLRALYDEARLIDHLCVPNATASFSKNGQIVVRAAVPIAKGTKILLDFGKSPFWGTLQRKAVLANSLFVYCCCDRCKDPSELDTFTSGIYCQKCSNQTGILLSENPLIMDSHWVCNSCSDRKPLHFILDILKRSKLPPAVISSFPTRDQCIAGLEDFIRKQKNILHPNHSLMTEVKLILYELYTVVRQEEPGVSIVNFDEMDKKEALLLDLLELVDVISPGLTKIRGTMLHRLAEIMYVRHEEMCLPNVAFVNSKLHESHLKKVHAMMKEAYTILSWYPDMKEVHQSGSIRLSLVELYLSNISSELAD